METNNAVIAYIDIETSPSLGYVWQMWEADVLKIEKEWFIMSFAVKFNNGKTKCYALPDFKRYNKNKEDDSELVKKLWEVFNEADIIIGQNLDKFDIKKSNARFIKYNLPPPSPYRTIDTLKIARSHFKFDSNKLGSLGEYLGLGKKVDTGGINLWFKCMSGDKTAWKHMKKYNVQDVDLLEKVYLKLRPWAKTHPNLALFNTSEKTSCPNCQSDNVQKRGYTPTNSIWYRRFQCQQCTAWFKGTESVGKLRPSNN